MKRWLLLSIVVCCASLLYASPDPLHGAVQRQDDLAVLQLENRSAQPLAICDIFAVRLPASVALDIQEKIDLPPGAHRQFSVPPGRYRLLIADCEGDSLVQQQDLLITRRYTLPLAGPASPAPPSSQPRPPAMGKVVLQIRNEAQQPICSVYISPFTDTDWGQNWLSNDTIAPGKVYSFSIVPGDYDVLLKDCDGNRLLEERRLTINRDYALALTQAAVSASACDADNQQGLQAYRRGRYAEALAAFQVALGCYQAVGDRAGEGTTLHNIAAVYDNQGRYGKALAHYEQALAILRAVSDRAGEGATLNNIGLVYHAQGRYGEALEHYEQALAIRRAVGDRAGEGQTLNNIGGVYDNQGRYGEALEHYEQALAITREVGDRAGEGVTLNNIAVVYEAQGQVREALDYYGDSIEVLESVRSIAGSDQARISFAEDYAVVYDRTIALYHQQDAVELAFWYSERGRARTLLDLLATDQVQLSDNQAALLAEGQQAYAIRQAAQEQLAKARAATPPDPAWVAEAEIALEAAEVAYEQIAATIARRSDQLASLIPGRQQVLQLAKVQALLDANTTLLSYWTLEDKTLAFVVTVNDTAIVELPGVTAQAVLTMTENLYHWRNLDNPHPAPLRKLYSLLIAPLADKLHTPHLAIIPHQSLHYVPFAALVDEINGKRYLGEQYTLSLLPSANLLPYLQQNAQAAQANHNANAIVFGDPASDEPDLPRLHYAATEASAVAALLQTSVLTDAAASEADLYQLVQGARVLHLAAHGGYNQANALYSAIYLAPAPPLTQTLPLKVRDGLPTVDTARDGRLETHEIFGLPLKGNDLVVLSACQTNVGELSRGDEVVGLTRAFFFAGSPTVISSLWSVDDAATEALMVSFYKHWLQDGMSKAQALQAAQTDVRTVQGGHWASPFYWAGFVLNGHSGEPVE